MATIFSRIVAGEIPSYKVAENEQFYAFLDINPVQSGTGTPSPQNVRPISGFSALNVTRTGKNLFNKSLLIDQVAWNIFTLQLEPNTTYTMGWKVANIADAAKLEARITTPH